MKIFEDKIYLDEDSFAFEIERKYKKKNCSLLQFLIILIYFLGIIKYGKVLMD